MQHIFQIKNNIMINVNVSVKSILGVKKGYNWNPSRCICENSRYLKSIIDNSVIVHNEIINVNASTM